MAAAAVAPPSTSVNHVPSPSATPSIETGEDALQFTERKNDLSKAVSSDKKRPCDACRRKKSKCVFDEGDKCNTCSLLEQDCTYLEGPLPRKRNSATDLEQSRSSKRKSNAPSKVQPSSTSITETSGKVAQMDQSPLVKQNLVLTHATYTGVTTEADPELISLSIHQGSSFSENQYHKLGSAIFALDSTSPQRSYAIQSALLETLDGVVGSYGPQLVEIYKRHIEVHLPVLEQGFFEDYRRGVLINLDPVLLGAVYGIALPWLPQEGDGLSPVLQAHKVREMAFTMLLRSLQSPSIASIQAGIILMQMPDTDTKGLNSQLVNAAYDLGLHLDCTTWNASDAKKALRRRLAWSLYAQDKWCSLIHGRPSLISHSNWAVADLSGEDFVTRLDADHAVRTEDSGMLFRQFVELTKILATILNTFYTLEAMQEVENSGNNGTRLILERAKPVQIRLKEWFSGLPSTLKIDASNASQSSATGFLHLAYFATEITLHRCIIRSLRASGDDEYLTHICRSAAKTRLISAMDFVNRLRSEHLQSFWYFPSRVAFALIGSFGFLLLATGPSQDEMEFYRTRLGEFRWTLSVSSRSASFLVFAVESLDNFEAMLKDLPERPTTAISGSQPLSRQQGWDVDASEDHSLDENELVQFGQSPSAVEHQQHPINATSGLISPTTSIETRSTYDAFA